MSSHQNSYYYSDSQLYYGSGASPIVRRSRSPTPSWPSSGTSADLSHYPGFDQSTDPVGNELEAYEAQDVNYSLNLPFYPESTSFQGLGAATNATYDDNNILFGLALPFSECDYGYSQQPSSYNPYEPSHDFPAQHFTHNADPMSDLPHSSSVPYTHDIYTPQTSQGLPPIAYASSSSTQLSPSHAGPVYDSRFARPSLIPDGINTASMELPNDGQHSHPSPVATSPLDQHSTAGPSRPSPSSPGRKRLMPLAPIDDSTARRVVPRSDRAWSVHSSSSNSHKRHRSTDVPGRGPWIPQDRYTTSSIPTYNSAEQHARIDFDLDNPNQTGIPIADILDKSDTLSRIRNPTEAFNMGKKTFSLRVQWPGYKPYCKTIAALNWKKSRGPVTRVKLADAVATAIRDLVKKQRDESYDPDSTEWNVGPNGIQLEQLCLVSLCHVSKGSWQPLLCLLEPRH